MKGWRYNLHVENCRAIKSADISLSEITVLSGVNASGKSTIAKIFRDLIEASVGYERLLAEKFWSTFFGEWAYSLNEIARYLGRKSGDSLHVETPLVVRNLLAHGRMTLKESADTLEKGLGGLIETAMQGDSSAAMDVFASLKRRLNVNVENDKLLDVFREKKNDVLTLFDAYVNKPIYKCYQGLPLYKAIYEGTVIFKEGDSLIFSNDDTLSQSQSEEASPSHFDEIKMIRRAVYIESPFKSMPASSLIEELDMGDHFTRLKNESRTNGNNSERDLFKVLAGGVEYEEGTDAYNALFGEGGRWIYHREDGKMFDLRECATGIRSFSILNALFSKGWLDSETLLIIDEPEAHLHPQWIVEYAKVLLLLSVKFKVRLFLTSHSPDMVNAIHTIGTAMGLSDVMDFYLAEKDAVDQYMFNYKHLGCNVGEIFKAYNVSFRTITEYAEQGVGK